MTHHRVMTSPSRTIIFLGRFWPKSKKSQSKISYFLRILWVFDPSDDDGELYFYQKSTLLSHWGGSRGPLIRKFLFLPWFRDLDIWYLTWGFIRHKWTISRRKRCKTPRLGNKLAKSIPPVGDVKTRRWVIGRRIPEFCTVRFWCRLQYKNQIGAIYYRSREKNSKLIIA